MSFLSDVVNFFVPPSQRQVQAQVQAQLSPSSYGDVPKFGDKLRPSDVDPHVEIERQKAEREASLNKLRMEHSALSPQGDAWSPNDSQFYDPDLVPGSEDTALLPKPSMIVIIGGIVLALIFLTPKGK